MVGKQADGAVVSRSEEGSSGGLKRHSLRCDPFWCRIRILPTRIQARTFALKKWIF